MSKNDSNPFATRYVRPGALEFLLPSGTTFANLLDKLRDRAWRGQILGPHGTGKSTLLHSLAPLLKEQGRTLVWFTQNQGARSLAVTSAQAKMWTATAQVIVDGYEQLGYWTRWWLNDACKRAGAGLLVTTHADVGLPTLFTTAPTDEQVQVLVRELLEGDDVKIRPDDVSLCYQTHAGNVRETLFALYDLYERRQRERS